MCIFLFVVQTAITISYFIVFQSIKFKYHTIQENALLNEIMFLTVSDDVNRNGQNNQNASPWRFGIHNCYAAWKRSAIYFIFKNALFPDILLIVMFGTAYVHTDSTGQPLRAGLDKLSHPMFALLPIFNCLRNLFPWAGAGLYFMFILRGFLIK